MENACPAQQAFLPGLLPGSEAGGRKEAKPPTLPAASWVVNRERGAPWLEDRIQFHDSSISRLKGTGRNKAGLPGVGIVNFHPYRVLVGRAIGAS